MNKRILTATLLVVFIFAGSGVNAQTMSKSEKLKEKFAEQKKKLNGGKDISSEELNNMDQFAQIDFINKKKALKIYPAYKDYCTTPQYSSKYPSPTEITNIIVKNDKIVSFDLKETSKIFYGKRTYTPSGAGVDANGVPTNVTCWKPNSGRSPFILAYNNTLYVIDNDPYISNECCIKGVYGKKEASPEELLSYVKPFIESRKVEQDKLNNKAKEASNAEHEKYTIANKEVSKLEIVLEHDDKFGIWSEFNFSVNAILKDGSILKTSEKGYLNDYDINVVGATSELLGAYTVQPQVTKLNGDYVLIEVSAKHDASIKTEKKIVLNYKNSVKIFYKGGNGWANSSGERGTDLRVEAKGVKHTETGENLVQFNIYNLDGDLLSSVRVRPDRSFFVSTKGGNGTDQTGENGKDGGNAGSITLVVDSNLKDYTFDYNVSGGTGGKTDNSYAYSNGRDGRDGSFTKKVQSVNW